MFVPVNVKVYFAMYYGVVIIVVVVPLKDSIHVITATFFTIFLAYSEHTRPKKKKKRVKNYVDSIPRLQENIIIPNN